MRYAMGGPVRLSTKVYDNTVSPAVLVNASTLTLTLVKPDATQAVFSSPTNDATGLYHQDLSAGTDVSQIGRYLYKWVATGSGASAIGGNFDVYDPLEVAVLSVEDAKDHLNIPQATITYDTELSGMIATAESALEYLTGGPIVNRSITERVYSTDTDTAIVVRRRPLVSLTSIVDVNTGNTIDISDVELNTVSSVIRRKTQIAWFRPFFGIGLYNVTYVAGWGTAVPPAIELAAKIIVGHMWGTQHGPSVRPTMQASMAEIVNVPGLAIAIPQRAIELMEPYRLASPL